MKDITFAQFWEAYGLKRDKIAAERAWKRLGKRDQRAAFSGIAAYREDCEKHGRMMMYAQGYITHRRWEDELQEQTPSNSPSMGRTPSAHATTPVPGVSPSGPVPSPAADRDREAEARRRRREEWERQSVSHEEAMKDPEYLRALREA